MVCVQKRNLLRLDRISRCGAKKEESTIIVLDPSWEYVLYTHI